MERSKVNKPNSNTIIHDNGLEIMSNGSIHSLAFISQLIVNPSLWDNSYHDSIYKDTDLYTFVLTLLNTCKKNKSADINIHTVAATDRGSRSYYTDKICIARLTEYTEYELLAHNELGASKARKLLKFGRKKLLFHRIASCFKLASISGDHFKIDMNQFAQYQSPYKLDKLIIRSLFIASKNATINKTMNLIYRKLYSSLLERKA
jgi:hypothetical protein